MEKANKIPAEQLPKIKELLANTALAQLMEEGDVREPAGTEVEFGYIYLRAGEYEGLFKVTVENQTVYFAARQGSLLRLQDTFSEEMFHGTVQHMQTIHGDWL